MNYSNSFLHSRMQERLELLCGAWKQIIKASHRRAQVWVTPCRNWESVQFIPFKIRRTTVGWMRAGFKRLICQIHKIRHMGPVKRSIFSLNSPKVCQSPLSVSAENTAQGFPDGRWFNWLLFWNSRRERSENLELCAPCALSPSFYNNALRRHICKCYLCICQGLMKTGIDLAQINH